MASNYTEKHIRSLDWKQHIRQRPGMYIGKLGDGSAHDDGIYLLLKEVIDNSIDEFVMGYGKTIEITLDDSTLTVRDFGRGVPLDKRITLPEGGNADLPGLQARLRQVCPHAKIALA